MDFLWSILFRKVVQNYSKAFVAGLVGVLASSNPFLQKIGVNITVNEVALVAFLVGVAEAARNYAKRKKGINWL